MIDFSNINYLAKQQQFIQDKLGSKSAVFLVGGAIRDLILNIDSRPSDIDVTLTWNPVKIYQKSDKKWLSHFITEKFGTITFIKKLKKQIQYEITPLRMESGYSDFRRPEEITWSNSLIQDSKRRDFSINSIYFFADMQWKKPIKYKNKTDTEKILKWLDRQWIFGIKENNLLIIQDHKIIETIRKNGIYQVDWLENVINKYQLWNKSDFLYFIIDPNQGIQDIINKRISCVGEPDVRFQEDALRLIRWIRITNILNHKLKNKNKNAELFDFEKSTWNSIKKNHKLIAKIAKERIKDELTKAFKKWNPFAFVSLLDESGLLPIIFPALYATKHIEQPVRYHPFDVYTHTMLSLFELQKINSDYLVRLAMLYHDVGKVAQFGAYKDELSKEEIREILASDLNHRKGWPDLVKKDFFNLWFSKKEVEMIARYVANHHKVEEIVDWKKIENRIKKMKKFLSQAWYRQVENILDITISDRLWQYNPLQNNSDLSQITELRELLKQINEEEWQFTKKDMKMDGNLVMKHFDLKASKLIWELLDYAFDRVISDIKTRNNKKDILKHLEWVLTLIKNKQKAK